MDERTIQVEVSEFSNFPKVTGNASNLAYSCGVQVCHYLEDPLVIFFHNAASVLSKKQKNVPYFFLCSQKKKYFENFWRTSTISLRTLVILVF